MRIALDMMGGDYAPKEACLGVLSFLQKYNDCQLILIGDQTATDSGAMVIPVAPFGKGSYLRNYQDLF